MSHDILGKRFAQQDKRRAPWHDIQNAVYQPATTPTEGLALINGDFTIVRCPVQTRWYCPELGTEVVLDVPDQYALVRPPLHDVPEPQVISLVGRDYELIQHADIARALDPLVSQGGWVLETLGILGGGGQFFSTFATGGFVVNEDEIDTYWIISEDKGRGAIAIFAAHTRVVCKNTYRVAEDSALAKLAIPHFRGAAQELDWTVQILAAAEKQTEAMRETLEQFGRTPIAAEQMTTLVEACYPMPALPRRVRAVQELRKVDESLELSRDVTAELANLQADYLRDSERAVGLREAVLERYEVFSDERSKYGHTAWAAWNALTEIENHRQGRARGNQVLFGDRAERMQRGYAMLQKMTAP